MSSGEALVESGSATVKSSCLSLQMKIIIGTIATSVIVIATVTPAVLLTGGASGSKGQVGNAGSVANESSTTANPLTDATEIETTDTYTMTLSLINSEMTSLNELQQTTPASADNITIGETSSSLNQNDVKSTFDPTAHAADTNQTTTSHINGGSTSQNGGNDSIGTTSTPLNQNSRQATNIDYQSSSAVTTMWVSNTTTTSATTPSTTTSTTTPSTTTLSTTTMAPCSFPYSQTLVFMYYDMDQDRVYLKGANKNITHISLGAGFSEYDRLAIGDTKLDWTGRENGQPTDALGSPTTKTSNDNSSALYFPLNTYGNNYWVMNVCMECPTTEWFEFKAYTNQRGWETISGQQTSCTGTAGENRIINGNHAAKCGKINVFTYGSVACRIDNF